MRMQVTQLMLYPLNSLTTLHSYHSLSANPMCQTQYPLFGLRTMSYCYAMRIAGETDIKFGYAKNPAKRLRQLQTGQPKKLELIVAWPVRLQRKKNCQTRNYTDALLLIE